MRYELIICTSVEDEFVSDLWCFAEEFARCMWTSEGVLHDRFRHAVEAAVAEYWAFHEAANNCTAQGDFDDYEY